MSQIIAFSGTGGVGKTTTAQRLVELYEAVYIPSVARDIFRKWGLQTEADQEKLSPADRLRLQKEMFYGRIHADREFVDNPKNRGKIGICDRSVFDQVAYQMLRSSSLIDEEEYVVTSTVARGHCMYAYRAVIYFPLVTYEGSTDGFRQAAYGLRWAHDAMIRRLLDGAVDFFTARKGSIDERAHRIASRWSLTARGAPHV